MIEFSAVRLGENQNGIVVNISKADFGGPGLPGVSVIGRTINVTLNLNKNNQSVAQSLIDAIQKSAEASNLVAARIVRRLAHPEHCGHRHANSSLVLTGANDIVIPPG